MNDYSNRQVEFPNRIQLIKVPGTEDVYDFVWVPGRITNPGGTANESFFKSIDDDIKAKLPITSKATQAQAEAGTDNTNYMTALTTKQAISANKVLYTSVTLSSSQITTLDLTPYLTNNVKVDILICAKFYNNRISGNYKDLELNGLGISDNEIFVPSYGRQEETKITICSYCYEANLNITIYPKQGSLRIKGKIHKYNNAIEDIDEFHTYYGLSNLKLGMIDSDDSTNPTNPVSIIQYKV